MHTGGYEGQLMHKVRQFNGGLFVGIEPIPLNAAQIQLLIDAGRADWRYVEPAIFGTLLERALDPRERHKLGAHFTPRAYVERLVMPTLIDPLRQQWHTVQVAAETWLQQGKPDKAVAELHDFHFRLCNIRVLDPACGSANFLYVALEHLKRLEGEVLNLIRDLSAGQHSFEMQRMTVDPHQFLGLEINPRAAAIAEIVLWIGYLQWHFRIHGTLDIPDPILRDFRNIQHRDALIAYDSRQPVLDDSGQPVTLWDGISYKPSPTTGELIPDDSGRIPVYHYTNPRRAEWPAADYIVGNPPFIGAATMRRALGDGYVDAVRAAFKGEVPDSADFVMYWWHIAAEKVRNGSAQRFGFITTNSIRQTFNRRVLEPHLNDSKKPLSLTFAIPDHPWVDSNDGAAVRIAMTVGAAGETTGLLRHVTAENGGEDESLEVSLTTREGKLFADLTIGANAAGAKPLLASMGVASRGVQLIGSGFIVTPEEARQLGLGAAPDALAPTLPRGSACTNPPSGLPRGSMGAREGAVPGLGSIIRHYRNGRDLTQSPRGVMVIDLFGLDAEQVKQQVPAVYQWVLERVKPERDQNKRDGYRKNWWIFGEARKDWRAMADGLTRYVATVETTKHRIFQFLDNDVLPDNKLINIAMDSADTLGILSSRIHVRWAMASGSWLGVGNDSVYAKTRCFETFPFPELDAAQSATIAQLAEQLDAHRKRQQGEFPELTLTGMYNVLEKLRTGETLNAKEKIIHQQGLVSILREPHDDLDRAVFAAYGWDDLAAKLVGRPGATTPLPDKPADQAEAEEDLLCRLVELNARRALDEANGLVRWLRPEYQARATAPVSGALELDSDEAEATAATPALAPEDSAKQPWPKALPEQVNAVRALLARGPASEAAIASHFVRKPVKSVVQILSALAVLGHAEQRDGCWQLGG